MTPSVTASIPERTPTQFYTCWDRYRCAYQVYEGTSDSHSPALLTIPPIGVGLSRHFWDRFVDVWLQQEEPHPVYAPDLLGCGESDMPRAAYSPEDWADQLHCFVEQVIQAPIVVIAQGASLPIALELFPKLKPGQIKGLIMAGPPAWPIITGITPDWQRQAIWKVLDSPFGNGFYRYARRPAFLESFSVRQLFATGSAVDREWLQMLDQGSQDLASRYAVFSFLAGFWRNDYTEAIRSLTCPTLVVMGEAASSIGKEGKQESSDQRLQRYLDHLQQGEGVTIGGRNVLPYESTQAFVSAITSFVHHLAAQGH